MFTDRVDKYAKRRDALRKVVNKLGHGGISEVASTIEKSPSYVSRLLYPEGKKGFRRIGEDTLTTLCAAYPDDFSNLAIGYPTHSSTIQVANDDPDESYVRLPLLGLPAGAGPGDDIEQEPEVVRWIDVSKEWANTHFPRQQQHIKVLTVRGDSMVGAGMQNDDLLFVDTSIRQYDGDGYYVLRFRNGWQVKRLQANVLTQQLEVVSLRAGGHEAVPVPASQEDQLAVGGRVAAWWTLRLN